MSTGKSLANPALTLLALSNTGGEVSGKLSKWKQAANKGWGVSLQHEGSESELNVVEVEEDKNSDESDDSDGEEDTDTAPEQRGVANRLATGSYFSTIDNSSVSSADSSRSGEGKRGRSGEGKRGKTIVETKQSRKREYEARKKELHLRRQNVALQQVLNEKNQVTKVDTLSTKSTPSCSTTFALPSFGGMERISLTLPKDKLK